MSAFIGDLIVKLIEDDQSGIWELVVPFSFQSDLAGITIVAPQGFRTDFCSVPRVPLAYTLLGDRARQSGTIHDALYTSHIVDRETADKVLHEMLLLNGVDEIEAAAFYIAVRQYGGSHWGPTPIPVCQP
jgi:hypothetical protein